MRGVIVRPIIGVVVGAIPGVLVPPMPGVMFGVRDNLGAPIRRPLYRVRPEFSGERARCGQCLIATIMAISRLIRANADLRQQPSE